MATISNLFGVREVRGAVVGLELEIEGENLPQSVPGDEWDVKRDGSLRGGLEYVFSKPLGSVATREALESIDKALKASGAVLNYSYRTSTHCHINVSNLEVEVVKTMISLFTLFEDEYINFCSRGRKANRFCLGAKDADGVIENINRFFSSDRVPDEGRGKYSALNLCTLSRFGTLEVRTLEGTDDWTRIFTWVRALLSLRKAAKDIGDRASLAEMPKDEIIKMLFPTERLREQFLKDGWQERFDYNKSVAWELFQTR